MYVCLCNGLRERDVRSAAQACGSSSPADVYASLGHEFDCGLCAAHARKVIRDELNPGMTLLAAE
jgi:bacterioferritin-associated ferredoxin